MALASIVESAFDASRKLMNSSSNQYMAYWKQTLAILGCLFVALPSSNGFLDTSRYDFCAKAQGNAKVVLDAFEKLSAEDQEAVW